MTLLTFDTQIMIYFNFFHITVHWKFKKISNKSLVQKPYFFALCSRAFSASFQSSHHSARASCESTVNNEDSLVVRP